MNTVSIHRAIQRGTTYALPFLASRIDNEITRYNIHQAKFSFRFYAFSAPCTLCKKTPTYYFLFIVLKYKVIIADSFYKVKRPELKKDKDEPLLKI